MTASFDLNLLPLYRVHGQISGHLPGFLASLPPKHKARGRESDILIVYLTLAGNAPISSVDYNQIASQMVQRFYQVPGALTSAMRTTAEVLNQYLIDRNTRLGGKGQHIIGRLILAVLRDDQITLAQSGPTHIFLISGEEFRSLHDVSISGRGLGIGPSAPLYLVKTEIHHGDQLICSTFYPSSWESGLPEIRVRDVDIIRQSLLDSTKEDLNGVIIHFQAGKGEVNILRGEQISAQMPATPPKALETHHANEEPDSRQPGSPSESKSAEAEQAPASEPARLDQQQPGRFVRPLGSQSPIPDAGAKNPAPHQEIKQKSSMEQKGLFVTPHVHGDLPEIARAEPHKTRRFYSDLAHGMRTVRLFFEKISGGFKGFLSRLLPALSDNETPRTGSGMVLVAIAVPLLIITIAVVVYLKYGEASQYKANYDMAVNAAVGAIGQEDPALVRVAWETTLHYLDEADKYQETPESKGLRQQAESALDGLNGVIRLDFRPGIYGGLDPSVKITRMASTGTELYLLDSTSGSILRSSLTSQGYALDLAFQCGPGVYNGQPVATLMDLAALPGNNQYNATVVAMDPSGTLIYCAPEMEPVVYPPTPPALGWGKINGFTLSINGREMYVMDSKTVWIYTYEKKDEERDLEGAASNFNNPVSYFGEQVPGNMSDAIDLAANGSDLFLLFKDSHVAVCTFNSLTETQTTCLDPAVFEDNRPGHRPGTTISDAVFSELLFDSPFNTALFLLEPNTQAVYKVSPHPSSLELGGQFHAGWKQERTEFMNTPAGAMTIDRNRYLFLSIGDQVYFASIP